MVVGATSKKVTFLEELRTAGKQVPSWPFLDDSRWASGFSLCMGLSDSIQPSSRSSTRTLPTFQAWPCDLCQWPSFPLRKSQDLWVTIKLGAMDVLDPDKKAPWMIPRCVIHSQWLEVNVVMIVMIVMVSEVSGTFWNESLVKNKALLTTKSWDPTHPCIPGLCQVTLSNKWILNGEFPFARSCSNTYADFHPQVHGCSPQFPSELGEWNDTELLNVANPGCTIIYWLVTSGMSSTSGKSSPKFATNPSKPLPAFCRWRWVPWRWKRSSPVWRVWAARPVTSRATIASCPGRKHRLFGRLGAWDEENVQITIWREQEIACVQEPIWYFDSNQYCMEVSNEGGIWAATMRNINRDEMHLFAQQHEELKQRVFNDPTDRSVHCDNL